MALGGRTVAELQAAMSSREFSEWQAYAQVTPFGQYRDDLRIAVVAALLAEANRDHKRRRKPYTVGEFMTGFDELDGYRAAPGRDAIERKKAEVWSNLKTWALVHGGSRVN